METNINKTGGKNMTTYKIIDNQTGETLIDEDGNKVSATNPSEDWINWADTKTHHMNIYCGSKRYHLKK
jgi:hypothetical protein